MSFAGDLVVFDAVNFKSVTSYRALDGKRYAFALRPAGMTNAKPLGLEHRGPARTARYYTVFALPGDEPHRASARGHRQARSTRGRQVARCASCMRGDGVGAVDVRGSRHRRHALRRGRLPNRQRLPARSSPSTAPVEIRAAGRSRRSSRCRTRTSRRGASTPSVLAGSSRATPPLEAFIIEDTLVPPTTTSVSDAVHVLRVAARGEMGTPGAAARVHLFCQRRDCGGPRLPRRSCANRRATRPESISYCSSSSESPAGAPLPRPRPSISCCC